MKITLITILLFIAISSCAKKEEKDDSSSTKSFNELITGTFKWKTFSIKETVNSSTTDYHYKVSHVVTDNYSFFGNKITNNNGNYSRKVFGKVIFSHEGRDNITFDCDGHEKIYENNNDVLIHITTINHGCNSQNYGLNNTTTYTDNISVKNDSIITQTILQENGTISRINTSDWERQ